MLPPFESNDYLPQISQSYLSQRDQAHRVAVQSSIDMMRNAALLDGLENQPDIPELLLQAVITPGQQTTEGTLVEAVALPWYDIIKLLTKDPRMMYELDWRKFEELIAGAYIRQGFEVTLTPRSGDGGRDVIAIRRDIGSIRFFDQVKRYKPGHIVTLQEVDAMLGVLTRDSNVSKGIVTTTATFAPRIEEAEGIKRFIPYRLELKDGEKLLAWLESLLPKSQ